VLRREPQAASFDSVEHRLDYGEKLEIRFDEIDKDVGIDAHVTGIGKLFN